MRSRGYRTRELTGPASDVRVDGLLDGGVEGRRQVLGEHFLPDAGGPLGGIAGAGIGPVLEVRPVGEQRTVERGLVTGERVPRTEEVPAYPDAVDGRDPEAVVAEAERLEHLGAGA